MPHNPTSSFSRYPNCLRKYRKAQGLKQKDVAKILGLKSTSRISQWEKGTSIPSLYNAIRLSLLYHVFIEALFVDHVRFLRDEVHAKYEEVLRTLKHPHE